MVAYTAPWIDLCSKNPVVSCVSRQVLNIEIAYANFVGVRTVIIPGPTVDNDTSGNSRAIAQYSRAINEALNVAPRLAIVIHMPMYREPGLDEDCTKLSDLEETMQGPEDSDDSPAQVELYGVWDAWHQIRTIAKYPARLGVGRFQPYFWNL